MPQSSLPYILSIITFLPALGALVVALLPRPKDLPDGGAMVSDVESVFDPARLSVKGVAFLFTLANFILSLALLFGFHAKYLDASTHSMQFMESIPWIKVGTLHVYYKMGADGMSVLHIFMTTLVGMLAVAFGGQQRARLKEFMVYLLLLQTGVLGVFCALDLALFYLFWEMMLIPTYLLIGVFGGKKRVPAAIKMFVFNFAASIFMLVAMGVIFHKTGSLDIIALSNRDSPAGAALVGLGSGTLNWLYLAFAIAFLVKLPAFPLHTWLADTYAEAPTSACIMLGVKVATFGLLRIGLGIFPMQAMHYGDLTVGIAVIAIIYGSMIASVQTDGHRLIAYSSLAHMGFVLFGIFSFTHIGIEGAILQNFNYGITSAMLLVVIGALYQRSKSRDVADFGGLKKIVPAMGTMLLLATLSSIAVPFFNGFVGEFSILQGGYLSKSIGPGLTGLAALGTILSAVYMLGWYRKVMLGPVTQPKNSEISDLSRNEWAMLVPLVVMIFWVGLASPFWTSRLITTSEGLLSSVPENLNFEYPAASPMTKSRYSQLDRKTRRASHQIKNTGVMKQLPSMAGVAGGGVTPPPANRAGSGSATGAVSPALNGGRQRDPGVPARTSGRRGSGN